MGVLRHSLGINSCSGIPNDDKTVLVTSQDTQTKCYFHTPFNINKKYCKDCRLCKLETLNYFILADKIHYS